MAKKMTRMRAELRRLLAGERTAEAAAEAERLLAEYRREEAAVRRPVPTAEELAEARRQEEAAKWRRVIAKRRGGGMGSVIWSPGAGRGRESGSVTYMRRQSPWRG
jgi:hypothetical protein